MSRVAFAKGFTAGLVVGVLMILTVLVALVLVDSAWGREASIPGPYDAVVVRVKDGDTFTADVRIWPGQTVRVDVRVRGIDTPEKGWRGKCERERELGKAATLFAESSLPVGETVQVYDVGDGKYAGRVVAGVRLADGTDYAEAIVAKGLAVAYDGGTKRSWCDE